MPDEIISSFINFIWQNKGILLKKRRRREFEKMTDMGSRGGGSGGEGRVRHGCTRRRRGELGKIVLVSACLRER